MLLNFPNYWPEVNPIFFNNRFFYNFFVFTGILVHFYVKKDQNLTDHLADH